MQSSTAKTGLLGGPLPPPTKLFCFLVDLRIVCIFSLQCFFTKKTTKWAQVHRKNDFEMSRMMFVETKSDRKEFSESARKKMDHYIVI